MDPYNGGLIHPEGDIRVLPLVLTPGFCQEGGNFRSVRGSLEALPAGSGDGMELNQHVFHRPW